LHRYFAFGPLGRLVVGLVVSGVCLALALARVDVAQTIASLLHVDWRFMALGVGALLASFLILALRWRVLLASAAPVPVRDTLSGIMVGYLVNTILPLRVGEFARLGLVARRHRLNGGFVLGTIVLERTLDLLAVLALVAAPALLADVSEAVRIAIAAAGSGTLIVFIVLVCLSRGHSKFDDVGRRVPGFVPKWLVEKLTRTLIRFVDGLSALRDRRRLVSALALSIGAWLVAGLASVFWIIAFHFSIPWYAGFLVLGLVNLGGAIPSSPGAIGVYDYLAVLALSAWGTDKSAALAYALTTHAVNILINIVIGSGYLAREGLTLRAIPGLAIRQERPRETVSTG